MMQPRLRYLPPGFDVPTSEREVLQAAKALIAEDGRWCQGTEFESHAAADADPFCGDWQACAVGAIQLVTMGVELKDHALTHEKFWDTRWDRSPTPERKLYFGCKARLDDAVNDYTRQKAAEAAQLAIGDADPEDMVFYSAVDKNDADGTTLEEMLDIFDVAIENSGGLAQSESPEGS